MNDQLIADIARDLADALMARAKTRDAEDQKRALSLMTNLCLAVLAERSECGENKTVASLKSE